MVPSGSGWEIAALVALGRCQGRHTSRQDRWSTHVNDVSVPRYHGVITALSRPFPAGPASSLFVVIQSVLDVIRTPGTTVRRSSFSSSPPLSFCFFRRLVHDKIYTRYSSKQYCLPLRAIFLLSYIFVLFRVSFSAKVYAPGPHGAWWLHRINEAAYYLK